MRGIDSVAVKTGHRWVLTGEKMWISLSDVADYFLVFAWSDPEKKRQRDVSGISAFIVERGFAGFSSGPLKEKWGILAGNTGYFKMDQVEVPAQNLVGREGEGFKIAMFALDQGRYTVAAGATGLIPCLSRRKRKVRRRAQDVGSADRTASACEGDDRPDGVRLSGVALAVDTLGMAKEQRAAEHARDRSRQMVFHRCLGASCG